ncbi:hypothetical protein NDU88_002050 [Pleurodeles waltl]|uniref:Uncharacterized protein n=1 Tax=Pleurodeles waltl TaxID=8319 RepID=A0AAV7VCP4_PLEWA|nr:hypothetical protein NDU88_002050 [Pleurodeles waltl]
MNLPSSAIGRQKPSLIRPPLLRSIAEYRASEEDNGLDIPASLSGPAEGVLCITPDPKMAAAWRLGMIGGQIPPLQHVTSDTTSTLHASYGTNLQ